MVTSRKVIWLTGWQVNRRDGSIMTVTISVQFPEETLATLHTEQESFARELPLLAAVKLYELGKLSSGRAAQLAGMTRAEFLASVGRYQISPFALSPESVLQVIEKA